MFKLLDVMLNLEMIFNADARFDVCFDATVASDDGIVHQVTACTV